MAFSFVCILFQSLCNLFALQKPDPNGYMDVECHPIISIPAPHDEVQYSEVSSFLLYYYNLHATTKKKLKGMQVDTNMKESYLNRGLRQIIHGAL